MAREPDPAGMVCARVPVGGPCAWPEGRPLLAEASWQRLGLCDHHDGRTAEAVGHDFRSSDLLRGRSEG